MELPIKLKNDIKSYCKLNKIDDIDGFIVNMVKQGLTVEKYGSTPGNVEPEVIEKIVIKEVEIIREVPVEVIIEKEVIKEVLITNNDEIGDLTEKINKLSEELTKVNEKNHNLMENLELMGKELTVEKLKSKKNHYNFTPPETTKTSSINWVSKDERDGNDIYGE